MAAYNVDIAIALKNSNKLIALRKELRGATKEITEFNKQAREQNKVLPVSINSFNKQLARARKLLDRAAVGTSSFNRAARALVNVEKEHNNQLSIKEKLLNKIRMEVNDPTFNLRQQRKQQIKENIRQIRSLRFTNVNPGRPAVVGDFGQSGGRIGPAQALNNSQGGFLAFNEIAKKLDGTAKKNLKQNTKTASLMSQQAARAAFNNMEFGVAGGQIGPATPLTRAEKFGFGKRGQDGGGLFAFPGGKKARIKGGIGSALIGGGFPALFGAGGISSVLGGIAGGAGGALAPGGGFAASIFATAIAAQIEKAQQFRKAIKKINDDLANMNIQSQFSRQNIKQLAKDFDITNDEALKLAETIKTFGAERGLGLLRAFGSIETFKVLAGLQDTGSVLGKIEQLQGEISEEKRRELLQTLATKGPLEAQLALEDAILEKSKKRNREADKREKKRKEFERAARGGLGLESIIAANKAKEQTRFEGIATAAVFRDDSQVQRDFLENTKLVNEQLRFLAEFRAPADELKEMLNPMRQILDLSVAIKDGFQESFSGIIRGTMTVGEAFRNMLNRIADHFLDTAARMAATQIQKGFLGLFSGMFNFGTTSRANQFLGGVANPFGGGGSSGVSFGSVNLGAAPKFANGGRPSVGRASIVGERGPELFVPDRAGTIIPNNAMGGAMNVIVNVDASGSSVEGDEQQGRELGRVISAAVQSELIQQKRPGGLLA